MAARPHSGACIALRLVVFGAEGQAREVCWYLHASGHECIARLVATPSEIPAQQDNVFTEDWLTDHVPDVDGFVLGVGTPDARLRIAKKMIATYPRAAWPVIVHPSAILDRSTAKLGNGVM